MNTKERKEITKAIKSDPKLSEEVKAFLTEVNTRAVKVSKRRTAADEREDLMRLQSAIRTDHSGIDEAEKTIHTEGYQIKELLPAFIFLHGGGWVTGDYETHRRLVRDLVVFSGCAAVFVQYSLSPEAVYPQAIRESYAATKWVAENGSEINIDGKNIALVGNGSGGNLATVTTMIARENSGPEIKVQILLWPVVEGAINPMYARKFGTGRYLTASGLKRQFKAYVPEKKQRKERYVSPLSARKKELEGLPPALILLAQNDITRHSAQAYARKLAGAGVQVSAVRYNGMIHDFGLINALAELPQTRAAVTQIAATLSEYLKPV
jgi:acetyl esterase